MLDGETLVEATRRWALEASKRKVIRVGDLAGMLGERGVAGLLAALAGACAVAGTVPMFSSIIGLPMLFLAVWLTAGGQQIALPNWLARRELSGSSVGSAFGRSAAIFNRLDRYMRPRSEWIFVLFGRRAIGVIALILCLILFLPIPLMNFLPSISIVLLVAGWLAMDGLMFVGALCLSGITLAILPIAAATLTNFF